MRHPRHISDSNSGLAGTAHDQRDEDGDGRAEYLAAGGLARLPVVRRTHCSAEWCEMGLGWVGASDVPPV